MAGLPHCQTSSRAAISIPVLINSYTALSYRWTPARSGKRILFNQRVIEIGQNLFDFLVAYLTQAWGKTRRERMLWIDQICIDQANIEERNSQVSVMNQIYKQAGRVFVWLGREQNMLQAMRHLRDGVPDEGRALSVILRHEYFSRMWVIQEVALTRKISVLCGDIELEWSVLQEALNPSFNPGRWDISPGAISMISETRRFTSNTLQRCFAQYCSNKCSEPRDKVYALLGLTSERWRIRIDYSKTVQRVFLDAVVALFEELFDIQDPQCFYRDYYVRQADPLQYRETALKLGKEMGIPQHHLSGIVPLLHHIQHVYLGTDIRNVRYVYEQAPTVNAYMKSSATFDSTNYPERYRKLMRNCSRDGGAPKPEGSINAYRRNPLLHDVISDIGLQPADPDATWDIDPDRMVDRWWFQVQGRTYFYNCPPDDSRQ